MLRWPAAAARRDELAEDRLPRLLLVAEGVAPPRLDRDEDWIRVPADEREVIDGSHVPTPVFAVVPAAIVLLVVGLILGLALRVPIVRFARPQNVGL